MKRVNLEEIEAYDDKRFLRPEVLEGERSRTLLLCLRPGQSVPAHRHEGYEILLHALRASWRRDTVGAQRRAVREYPRPPLIRSLCRLPSGRESRRAAPWE